jgi:hypothetical protein
LVTSYVIKKEQCPMCKKLGKDNSKDNLAVYSDGRKWCFSCQYYEFPNKITSFKNKIAEDDEIDYQLPYLPVDCDILYPHKAIEWIEQYQLTREDLYKHNVLWSETMQRLIFPVFGDGHLIAWQGRYFGDLPDKPKWYGKGNLKDTYNILNQTNRIVLTEDIISAIKVSKCGVGAMPLYGSFVGRERFKRLYNLINKDDEVLVWLDPDKRKEGTKEAELGRLYGINCRTILSSYDPKEHSYEEIKRILGY